MIHTAKKRSIVYHFVTVSGLPYPIAVVRDPEKGGYTAYMPELSSIIVEGDTVKEAAERLKVGYKYFLDYKSKNK